MPDLNFRPSPRRSLAAAGVAVATAGALGLLSACGGATHPSSAGVGGTAITPGHGQSQAGMPGAGGTAGAPSPVPDASAMPSMSMPASPAAPGAPVAGNAVTIQNFAFSPAVVKIKPGSTVTWTNRDTDAHTVTSSGSGGPLHSSALTTGATYRYTFTKPGTYAYFCTIHPFMTATVEVTP